MQDFLTIMASAHRTPVLDSDYLTEHLRKLRTHRDERGVLCELMATGRRQAVHQNSSLALCRARDLLMRARWHMSEVGNERWGLRLGTLGFAL